MVMGDAPTELPCCHQSRHAPQKIRRSAPWARTLLAPSHRAHGALLPGRVIACASPSGVLRAVAELATLRQSMEGRIRATSPHRECRCSRPNACALSLLRPRWRDARSMTARASRSCCWPKSPPRGRRKRWPMRRKSAFSAPGLAGPGLRHGDGAPAGGLGARHRSRARRDRPTTDDNLGSCAVLARLGFQQEGEGDEPGSRVHRLRFG